MDFFQDIVKCVKVNFVFTPQEQNIQCDEFGM